MAKIDDAVVVRHAGSTKVCRVIGVTGDGLAVADILGNSHWYDSDQFDSRCIFSREQSPGDFPVVGEFRKYFRTKWGFAHKESYVFVAVPQ